MRRASPRRDAPDKGTGYSRPITQSCRGYVPILLFLNIKGGVAKTTTAVAVSESLANLGHRVLLIDADHQCASSELLLGERRFLDADRQHHTLHDLLSAMLKDEFPSDHFRHFVERDAGNILPIQKRLSVMPCSFRINDFQTNAAKARRGFQTTDEFRSAWGRRIGTFRAWLRKSFDFTIVDCPPSLALQVRFLLSVGDAYVIPCIPDRISVRGARWLGERLEKGRFAARPLGIAWTLYREQNDRHRTMVGLMKRSAQQPGAFQKLPKPFSTIVPNAAAIVRASDTDELQASFSSKYSPPFAKVFESLAREILARVGELP